MNDDYLWDRTGEPDPEIKELEEVLGTLRYQPQPLELPAAIRPVRERRYFPSLAIAAAIVLMILAAGLWLRVHRSQTRGQYEIVNRQPPSGDKSIQPVAKASPASSPGNQFIANDPDQSSSKEEHRKRRRRAASPANSFARKVDKQRVPSEPTVAISPEQREAVAAAKEQLMLALRLVSAKLSLAQRKTQGPLPGNIRNQHKVG